jgi:hypothetical protein
LATPINHHLYDSRLDAGERTRNRRVVEVTDLFGILDLLAVGLDILGVQTTSGSHTAKRVRRLRESNARIGQRKATINPSLIDTLSARLASARSFPYPVPMARDPIRLPAA